VGDSLDLAANRWLGHRCVTRCQFTGAFEEFVRHVNNNVIHFIRADISPNTNLYILRRVGDEALLSLGGVQMLSGAVTKAHVYLAKATKQNSVVQKIFLLVLFVSIVMATIPPGNDATSSVISKIVGKFALLATCFGGGAGILGAAVLLLVVVMSLGSVGFGVVPPNELEMGKVWRWITAVLSVLVVEVHAEEIPPGSWTVKLLEREGPTGEASNGALIHSAYNDPRVHEALVHWLETSSHTLELG